MVISRGVGGTSQTTSMGEGVGIMEISWNHTMLFNKTGYGGLEFKKVGV